jgi:hypothetical protein
VTIRRKAKGHVDACALKGVQSGSASGERGVMWSFSVMQKIVAREAMQRISVVVVFMLKN